MSERLQEKPEILGEITLTSVGHVEKGGRLIARDLMFYRGGKAYIISVGTKEYLQDYSNFNPDFKEDEGVLELDDVSDVNKIGEKLRHTPLKFLTPFLVEQTQDADVEVGSSNVNKD